MHVPRLILVGLVLLLVPSSAVANDGERSWHAGINLRTELGTHPMRVNGGMRIAPIELNLVLDPMFWTDGQHDLDLVGTMSVTESELGVFAGLRSTSLGLSGGRHYHELLLLGLSAPLGGFGDAVGATWGFELGTVILKHGAGLPTETISLASGRDFIDLVNVAMFVRFDYEGAL